MLKKKLENTMTTMKKKPKKPLVRAEGADCFWINDGPIVSDLKELDAALKKMDHATFSHHVSKERNDFANWVHYVLGDTDLAKKLSRIKTKPTTIKTVEEHLKLNY